MIVTLHQDLDSVPSETSRVLSESKGVVVDINGHGRDRARITVKIGNQTFEFSAADEQGAVFLTQDGAEIAKAFIA